MDDVQLKHYQKRAMSTANAYVYALNKGTASTADLLYLKAQMEKAQREYDQAWKDFQMQAMKAANARH